MIAIGVLVKPTKRGGSPWRLGVVVDVLDGDRFSVRAYVAPPGAYEGSAAAYRRDEIAEVPRAHAERYLQGIRLEIRDYQLKIASNEQLARQIENALAASTDDDAKR